MDNHDQERWAARGEFEELLDERQTLTAEIITLADAIRRKIPEVNDSTTPIIPHLEPAGAVPLLARLCDLHVDYKQTDSNLAALAERWGFKQSR